MSRSRRIERKRIASGDFPVDLPTPPVKRVLFPIIDLTGDNVREGYYPHYSVVLTPSDSDLSRSEVDLDFLEFDPFLVCPIRVLLRWGLDRTGNALARRSGTLFDKLPVELLRPLACFAPLDNPDRTPNLGEYYFGFSYWDGGDLVDDLYGKPRLVFRATPAPLPFATMYACFKHYWPRTAVCSGYVTRGQPCLNKLVCRQPKPPLAPVKRKAANTPCHKFHLRNSREYGYLCGYCYQDSIRATHGTPLDATRCHSNCDCHKPGGQPCGYPPHTRKQRFDLGINLFN